jgi:hypothetical protein
VILPISSGYWGETVVWIVIVTLVIEKMELEEGAGREDRMRGKR